MARRLSIRSLGDGAYEVGPRGHGPTVIVSAHTRKGALEQGRAELRAIDALPVSDGRHGFREAVRRSFRYHMKADRSVVDTRPLKKEVV